ncbi:nucleolar protein 6 Mat89Ba isoform X2 [Tachypleus tridentatus]|uniref:nucleolar protein 6 Mat89Ba isoform X2 n=1 Tax=Tachypleus tridentatus TaxID=6853 RepID=UPI003FD50552
MKRKINELMKVNSGNNFEETETNEETDDCENDSESLEDENIKEVLEEDGQVSNSLEDSRLKESNKLPKKFGKLSKEELFKPPSRSELNNLKETEMLFHSNLFKMQTEELLKEVKVKPKWKKKFEPWLHALKEYLSHLKETPEYELSDLSWLRKKNVKVPLVWEPQEVKGKFCFLPPSNIRIVGSYLLDLVCRPSVTIDIAVEIPKETLQHGDFLNHRYCRKRALYLTILASELKKTELVKEVSFTYSHGDPRKPCLLITPMDKPFTVCLLPHAPTEYFKPLRFLPRKNNIRPSWFFGTSSTLREDVPTPHYNASVLRDLKMVENLEYLYQKLESSPGVRDAILMLKVWLHQRNLDKIYGGFTRFIMTMFVAYLLKVRRVSPLMSSYQVLRTVLLSLSQADWCSQGITLCNDVSDSQRCMEEFHSLYEVVFLDSSGFLNLCADMSKETFQRVVHEAELGLKILDSCELDSFDALFMKPVPFRQKFDYYIRLKEMKELDKAVSHLTKYQELLDRGFIPYSIMPGIISLLREGLGKRIHFLDVQFQLTETWTSEEDPPYPNYNGEIIIGILMNQDNAKDVLDKGPTADSPEAEAFREFWGHKSELRRFQDGSICEAVLWPASSVADKRMIFELVAKFVLEKHAGISAQFVEIIGGQLDHLLTVPSFSLPSDWPSYGTGEEAASVVIESYNSLVKKLRSVEGLPLSITSIQGISPVFRGCEVFPPVPISYHAGNKITTQKGNCTILKGSVGMAPKWIQPLKVVVHMEGSGKWPDDIQAIRQVKAAFHIRLAELLKRQFSLTAAPFPEYVDIFMDGYVFRIIIACHKELILSRQVMTPEGMVAVKHSEESQHLERQTVLLPKLTSTLQGLHAQHSIFSASCRLAKRWVNSQLLGDHISEVCIELLVASLFLSPTPFTVPGNHDWQTSPLILNLNNEFKKEDFTEIQNTFTSQRATLPPMVIAIPQDKVVSSWTRHSPSFRILHRLVILAKEALVTLEKQLKEPSEMDIKVVFRPPLDLYDVIIHLRPLQIPKRHLGVDYQEGKFLSKCEPHKYTKEKKLPVVDYDPVVKYLEELNESFEEFALFFYDHFGGEFIGVLWKPFAFEPKPFKISHIGGRMIKGSTKDGEASIVPNVEAILEDFSILGTGLVRCIETKTEKWMIE